MKKLKIQEHGNNNALNIALDTIHMNKQALLFANSKRSAERAAEDIAIKVKHSSPHLSLLAQKALKALPRPTKQCRRLALCLRKGVAFHHAGLHPSQRELIEDAFREGKIRIIACTPTLAAGLDLPAFRTIIKDLRRYTGNQGMQYIPVLEYLQMAGRAGRPGKEEYGEAICIAASEPDKEDIYERYVCGVPEDIYSKLAVEPVLRTYLLSLIATKFVNDKKSILDFFSRTFWAHQFKDMKRLEAIIDRMLHLLDSFEFIRFRSDDFVSADDLSDEKITATPLGRRVAELYLDPLTAHKMIECLRKVSSGNVSDYSFIHMVASQSEMRPFLKVRTREWDDYQDKLSEYTSKLLIDEPSIYDEEYGLFMDAFKTSLFIEGWADEKDEEFLLEEFDIRPGEIRSKLDRADWLLYASVELTKMLHFKNIITKLNRTRMRLKYGVKEELLALLRLKNVGRVRARKLFDSGIRDLGDVKKADPIRLSKLVGKRIALDIKDQVGESVKKDIPSTEDRQSRLI